MPKISKNPGGGQSGYTSVPSAPAGTNNSIVELRSHTSGTRLVVVKSDGTTISFTMPPSVTERIISSDDPIGALVAAQKAQLFRY